MDQKLIIIADHVVDSKINLSWIVFFSVCTDSCKLDSFEFIISLEFFFLLKFFFVALFADFVAKLTEIHLLSDNFCIPNVLVKAFHTTMEMIKS